ncbi:hypothetical protein [Flaviaesturariibacter amylovorans]|uniref:hypothetical protein n=1 Tax=Flaviaesturariibacter amylovorans TaxID=1084520 RepID=UPI0031E7C33C
MTSTWPRLLAFFLLLAALVAGCAKEYSFEGGGPYVPPRRCVDCPFIPVCDSSVYTYYTVSGGTEDTLEAAAKILGDTLIGGTRFTQVSGYGPFAGGLLYNCDAGIYRIVVPLGEVTPNLDSLVQDIDSLPLTLSNIRLVNPAVATVLKANAPLNSTWFDTLATADALPPTPLPFPITLRVFAGIDYTLVAKDATHTVQGRSYSGVSHVHGKMRIGITSALPIPIPVPPLPVSLESDYYLARDVGVIEFRVANDSGVITRAELIRYIR